MMFMCGVWGAPGREVTSGVVERVEHALQAQSGAAPLVRHVPVQRLRARKVERTPAHRKRVTEQIQKKGMLQMHG